MSRKIKVELTTDFLHAHGIRVSLDTFKEMVLEEMGRMRHILDQPKPADLTEDEIAALQRWRP